MIIQVTSMFLLVKNEQDNEVESQNTKGNQKI